MQTVVNNSSKQTTKSHEEKNSVYYITLKYIAFLTKFSLKLQMEKEIPIENKNSANVKKNIDKI